jgi:hypothetical protein
MARARQLTIPRDDRRHEIPNNTQLVRKPSPGAVTPPVLIAVGLIVRARMFPASSTGELGFLDLDPVVVVRGRAVLPPRVTTIGSGATVVDGTTASRSRSVKAPAVSLKILVAASVLRRTHTVKTPDASGALGSGDLPPFPQDGQSLLSLSDLRYLGCYRLPEGLSGSNVSFCYMDTGPWAGQFVTIDGTGINSEFKVFTMPDRPVGTPVGTILDAPEPGFLRRRHDYWPDGVWDDRAGLVTLQAEIPSGAHTINLGAICEGNYRRHPDDPDQKVYRLCENTNDMYNGLYWESGRQRLWVFFASAYGDPARPPAPEFDYPPGFLPGSDTTYPVCCNLDFSDFEPGNPDRKPILRGPWGFRVTSTEIMPYEAIHTQVMKAPSWIQDELNARPDRYYWDGVVHPEGHFIARGHDRSTFQAGSWGPGLAVIEVPRDDTPTWDKTINPETNKYTLHPVEQPGGVANADVPCCKAQHLSYWKSFTVAPQLPETPPTPGLADPPRTYSLSDEPSYWRIVDGYPVWSKDSSHLTDNPPIWNVLQNFRWPSKVTYNQWPTYRLRPNGRYELPTQSRYTGDPSGGAVDDLVTPSGGEPWYAAGYGGWLGNTKYGGQPIDASRISMDGTLQHAYVLLETPRKIGLLSFRARVWGDRWYGGTQEYAAPRPDVLPEPAADGLHEFHLAGGATYTGAVVPFPWVTDPVTGKAKAQYPFLRVEVSGTASSLHPGGVQIKIRDRASGVWQTYGGLSPTKVHYAPSYDHSRGTLYFVIQAVADGASMDAYQVTYVNGDTEADVRIRTWPISTVYQKEGEGCELFTSEMHPPPADPETPLRHENPWSYNPYSYATSGGTRGFCEEVVLPIVGVVDPRRLIASAKVQSPPDQYEGNRLHIEPEIEAISNDVWQPTDTAYVYGTGWGFFGYNGWKSEAKTVLLNFEEDCVGYYWDRPNKRLYIQHSDVYLKSGSPIGLVNVFDTSALEPPEDLGPTAARAISYDADWRDAWVTHCKALYDAGVAAGGKTEGFLIHIGDSLTHSHSPSTGVGNGTWACAGAGKTPTDLATTTWLRADDVDVYTTPNPESKNGFHLAICDITDRRGFTCAGDLSAREFIDGDRNDGIAMPSVTSSAALAKETLASPAYLANIRMDTALKALEDAQFALVLFNFGPDGDDNTTDLETLLDALEAKNIVPILSTESPRNGPDEPYNARIRTWNTAITDLARARSLPLIDWYAEIIDRRPTDFVGTLIQTDGIHPTHSGGGYNGYSDPYADGGDAVTGRTGAAAARIGSLLRTWLTVQKMKQIKSLVVDA